MIHSRRPLQEKMALFWHNHFATAYSKLVADSGEVQAAKMLAHKPGVLRGPQGQIELFRQYALGNYRDLLLEVAKDPAMVVWLDGKSNTKAKPQENFGREIMELFTVGVGHYTEPDVYAAARVFTGWNLQGSDGTTARTSTGTSTPIRSSSTTRDQHETNAKTFSFPIYSDGSRTIPARSESDGMQDGVDLITALAIHPETARRLARKFWDFFVSEIHPPDPAFVESTAAVYLQNRTEIRPVVRYILTSSWFNQSVDALRALCLAGGIRRACDQGGGLAEATRSTRSGRRWPAWASCSSSRPTSADGRSASTGSRPGRCWRERISPPRWRPARRSSSRRRCSPTSGTPQALLAAMLDRVTPAPFDTAPQQALMSYLLADGAWTGSGEQLNTRAAGLARLLVGSSEYQLV